MTEYSRCYASINLDAIKYNLTGIKEKIPKGIKIAGVIKADGYGHGAVPVAKSINDFVSFFCVATKAEAINLRRHNISKPILILGPVFESDYAILIENDIRLTVFTLDQAAKASNEAVKLNKKAFIHLALDTGMSRIGFQPSLESIELIKTITKLPSIVIEGLFTHLYKGDELDKKSALNQIDKFSKFKMQLIKNGINIEIYHVGNSAAIVDDLALNFDMLRAGIIIYGIYPSDEVNRDKLNIKQAMSIYSKVTFVKEIEAGTEISYGGTFIAKSKMKIATIPVGYADGYPRSLSNKGYVLVNNKKAQICGRICMDQFMVDVTQIENVKAGTTVTLLGGEGDNIISIDEIAKLSGRFPYEFVCDITKRVPRVYYANGEKTGSKDYEKDDYDDFL